MLVVTSRPVESGSTMMLRVKFTTRVSEHVRHPKRPEHQVEYKMLQQKGQRMMRAEPIME
jgi:hypothetical protein